jgi:hypothetical protein
MGNLALNGSSSGQITISPPAVAGTNTLTLPAATGTVLTTAGGQSISGTTTFGIVNATTVQIGGNQAVNGPTFSYYQSVASSLTTVVYTKITFTSSEFDTTGGMVSSSRFTPTISGYYQISAGIYATNAATIVPTIYKNGSAWKQGSQSSTNQQSSVSALVFLNGSTDYVEIYAYNSAATQNTVVGSALTYFQGVMVRGA